MKGEPSCPRCGGRVRAPGLFSQTWECEIHGAVPPLQPVVPPSVEALDAVVRRSRVPVWLPWPLPVGWLYAGVAHAGDDRDGSRAVAVACTGPAPLGGRGELLLIAEEVGVGLGARYAGLPGHDPGGDFVKSTPAKVVAAGRPTPLWCVIDAPPDRAVYAGEAMGLWLWAILWPGKAGHLVYDDVVLTDLREAGAELQLLPCGALSPQLLGF
ncbi:DUF6758 family protein [Embleya sp. NPDC005575]|uniref:DUF6758 family protein n=1 Tax=Embleya sp. NPDC005575 TaxID=3156892 RepID=UPI0033AA27FF